MKAKLKLKPAAKTGPTRSAPKKQPGAKLAVPSLKGVDLHAYGRRWQKGENIAVLAKEIGSISWNRLHSELTQLGYHKGN